MFIETRQTNEKPDAEMTKLENSTRNPAKKDEIIINIYIKSPETQD